MDSILSQKRVESLSKIVLLRSQSAILSMSNRKKIVFVANPISGTQGKEQVLKCIESNIDREKYAPEILLTEYAGHAAEIAAQKAREGIFAVVAVGGDGTINEVARSLVHTQTALGIIPCGSGNGLARHVEIPMDAMRALRVINEALVSDVDYGTINDIPFFCTCGVGFDAFVSQKFADAGKRGPLTYIEKTLQEGLKYKPETYELEIDGNPQRIKAFLIAVGNASQYGNNAYIAPQATINDGQLDVTIMEPFTVLDAPSIAIQLFSKQIDQNSHIKTFRCRELRIIRSKAGIAHYDGDPIELGAELHVKVVHRALKLIVPSESERSGSSPNVFVRAQEYFSGLKQFNEMIVEDIAQKNKAIIGKGKEQIKKLIDN